MTQAVTYPFFGIQERKGDPKKGMFRKLDVSQLDRANEAGFGIFHAVNGCIGGDRKNLGSVRAWYTEIDDESKDVQRAKIATSPLQPTCVVESKNGYHLYWYAIPGSSFDDYTKIELRLIEHFGGDPNAQDKARILRTPGFRHQKDPSDPFWVRWHGIPDFDLKYSANTMLLAFKATKAEGMASETRTAFVREFKAEGDSLWSKVYSIDCADALARLSGSGYVGGERYTFRQTRGGNQNIIVDGTGTACWIDCDGRIGSSKKGGPTIYNWLSFFGHTPAECVRIIKETYPGIED